nr:hypothetical protein [Spirochaetaceae bacterium]
ESSSLVRMEDDDYPLFYIFDGTRDIYAPREGLVNLKLLDRYKVEQTLSGSTTGAGFLEDSSMRFYGAAFPVDQGQLLSHSQNFYIQIPKTADYQRRTIFSTQSPGDDLSLSLISLEDQLIASLGLGSSFQRLVLDLKNEYFDRPLLVTLSLRIEGDQWSLLAYLDGEFQKSITWEQPVKEMLAVGETYWGAKAGASGFQGMLFGWMIYCQEEDSQYIDQQDIFAFTKELYWGDNVVLAQGFDTMTLQGAHSVEEPIIPKESKIFIPPEEILTFDALPIKQGKLYFDIQGLSNLDDSVYVRFNQGQWALLPLSNGLGELKIKDQRILRLNEDEVWVPFKQIEESEEELTMEMEFRSNEGLFIDSLFIHQ